MRRAPKHRLSRRGFPSSTEIACVENLSARRLWRAAQRRCRGRVPDTSVLASLCQQSWAGPNRLPCRRSRIVSAINANGHAKAEGVAKAARGATRCRSHSSGSPTPVATHGITQISSFRCSQRPPWRALLCMCKAQGISSSSPDEPSRSFIRMLTSFDVSGSRGRPARAQAARMRCARCLPAGPTQLLRGLRAKIGQRGRREVTS